MVRCTFVEIFHGRKGLGLILKSILRESSWHFCCNFFLCEVSDSEIFKILRSDNKLNIKNFNHYNLYLMEVRVVYKSLN
jgi:hypothetical protein